MKRLILLICIVFLLCGCSAPPEPTTEPAVPPTTEPTPWVTVCATPWDEAGTLFEISLTIPDGLHYNSMKLFDGDLLLWSVDGHRLDTYVLELCLVELDTGEVAAQRDIPLPETVIPQVLGEHLYLCSGQSGRILKLDRTLETVETWNLEPDEGTWYMGQDVLYISHWEKGILCQPLPDGQREPLEDFGTEGSYLSVYGSIAQITGYDSNTGAPLTAALDLLTGEIREKPIREGSDSVHFYEGSWICGSYGDTAEYYLCRADGTVLEMEAENRGYRFTEEGKILATLEESKYLELYDLEGKNLGRCQISANPYSISISDLVWNDTCGGYFLFADNYAGDLRLLFWDMDQAQIGDDLVFEEYVPLPTDIASLQEWADELSEQYGVYILLGSSCDTQFDEFSATICENPEQVGYALDILDQALSVYPEGFFRQLRFDGVQGIRFQLIQDLLADGSGRYGDGYVAFAQQNWDHYLVVVDIFDADETTYYHEISHVIDSFLESQSWQREDALYSEVAWAALNPDWFTGYSYDYSIEHELYDYTSFVDSYSTVSPTEDRARVMEYAMVDYGEYMFADCPILLDKLQYYCDCIRDGFDTTGWPEELPWEQFLYLVG